VLELMTTPKIDTNNNTLPDDCIPDPDAWAAATSEEQELFWRESRSTYSPLTIRIELDIHTLIARSVPYWSSLQPVEGGADYWGRLEAIAQARQILARAKNGQIPIDPGVEVDILAAADFLDHQKAAFMRRWEASAGAESRLNEEDRLEQMRPGPPGSHRAGPADTGQGQERADPDRSWRRGRHPGRG
jgi:hypothetical protein